MEPFTTLTSRTVVLPAANIDTDQIIPARFLTTTTRSGLGRHLFADWRYAPDGSRRTDFALNRPEAEGCRILVAGGNFGCGSSRERSEEHTSELQSRVDLVCRLLLEKKKLDMPARVRKTIPRKLATKRTSLRV